MNPCIKPYKGLFKTNTVKAEQQMKKIRHLLREEDTLDLSRDEIIDLLHFATMSTYLLGNLPEKVLDMIQENLDSFLP